MFAPLKYIEQNFYKIRDFLWDYPGALILDHDSFFNFIKSGYFVLRPYSHVATSVVIIFATLIVAFSPNLLYADDNSSTLYEGVVMGVDQDGDIQTIDAVTPLVPSRYQLGSDLLELIYEPLIDINSDGEIVYRLAEKVEPVKDPSGESLSGVDYLFTLRDDVFWHDGNRFTTDDVVATFNKLVELAEAEVGTNKAQALTQMDIVPIDDYSFRMFVVQEDDGQVKLFPNFLELVSFKIMPSRYLEDVNPLTVSTYEPEINRRPIGTGKYEFSRGNNEEIEVTAFESYYGEIPQIDTIRFKLYKNEDAVVNASKNGEIHSFVLSTSEHIRDLERFPNIQLNESTVIYSQYWGLYFNLVNGPEAIQDKNVRKALAYSINYDQMLESILRKGDVTRGPIPLSSNYFNSAIEYPYFDIDKASEYMEEAGWSKNSTGKWVKDDEQITIEIKFADQYDRLQVVDSIAQDWRAFGVNVVAEALPLSDLRDNHLIPRVFDAVVYGMNTFVDPDRFELFHSTAIEYPGLNISGYQSEETTKKIENRKVVDVPRSDRNLEIGQSTLDQDLREEEYNSFQSLLNDERPVIFLYHPKFAYASVKSLRGVDLSGANSIEGRFSNISEWVLE